jgi:small-conductance mechanosensitive channel
MDIKINQLRNDLIAVRNQREAANAVHRDAMKTQQLTLQSLESKVHIVEQKGALPHEAKRELDRAYKSCTLTPAHRRPLQCIVVREAVLLATMRHLERLINAKQLSRSMGDKVRKSMLCELTTIEDERMKLWIDFHHARNAIIVEKKAMKLKSAAILRHQRMMLEKLDPTRMVVAITPTKKQHFFDHLVATTSPMSKLLGGTPSPMSLFKGTSNIFQIAPRTV